MGHYLSTLNSEAAQAIQPQPAVTPRARVGDMVRYYPRPGEGGGGRSEFSALVTVSYEDGRIDGIVFLDANDFRDLKGIPPKAPQHEWPAWEARDQPASMPRSLMAPDQWSDNELQDIRNDRSPAVTVEDERVAVLQRQVADLQAQIKSLAGPNYSIRLDPVPEGQSVSGFSHQQTSLDQQSGSYSAPDAESAPKRRGRPPKVKVD